jgi:hypothetical protein
MMCLVLMFLFCVSLAPAQSTAVDFDVVDSLIQTTPGIYLCDKDGKEDLRFFSKTPESLSNYKQEFARQMTDAFNFDSAGHFFCDISVEVNCKGKAGNYRFAIEPRTFSTRDLECLKQLIVFVNKLRDYEFKPAYYLNESVNSKVRFRLAAIEGKAVLQ